MMMMSSLKQVLIFGVGLVVALGFYPLMINTKNTNPSYWPPEQYNTINDTDPLISAVNLKPDFHYFLFVLQWPAAFCNIQRTKKTKCNPDHPLAIHQNKFTIHGLWPQLKGANPPLSCSPVQQSLTYNDLVAVQKDLLEYWPDLFDAQKVSNDPNSLWMHEWNKHGTCSSDKFSPQKYLDTTIKLAEKYAKPIFDELKNRGIKPDGGTPHKPADITEAVKHITKSVPMLNMKKNGLGEHLLLEIKLCVEEDVIKLFDCDDLVYYRFAAP